MAKTSLAAQVTELQDANAELQAEIVELREALDRSADRDDLNTATAALKEHARLITALFEFLYDGEHGGLDEHIYRKEKLALWRWADSLDIEVPK